MASTSTRGSFLAAGVGVIGTIAVAQAPHGGSSAPASTVTSRGVSMNFITVKDGAELYYKDWGSGRPVVFSHGWPLTADAWEDAMLFLAMRGYRCIAADRRGHGRSSQTWGGNDIDTYADDLAQLVEQLSLQGALHVGHSTGGGEVARYVGRYGTAHVSGVVLVSDITPVMLKSATNPLGTPIEAYDHIRAGVLTDRAQFFREISVPFYGANRPGAKVSQGLLDSFVSQCLLTGMPACYFGVKPSSEVDFTADLRRIDVPTLIVHGSDDQFVPLADSALLSAKIVSGAQLIVYEGAPHGLPSTEKDRFNTDLLTFANSLKKS
jgi:non-heme chloroperoxidase